MLRAHIWQKDKAGRCYIFHPLNVALGVKGVRAKTVALLHDVLEDSDLYSIEDFKFLDKEQMKAILLLTHNSDEDYFNYIDKIKTNKIASVVKLSDLRHNSNLKRLKTITEKDISRREKYLKAIEILSN
ncbi:MULTISPECIES: GTP pyrophosphokinase [unclassified Parvimonas]|uniref:GTP pyrophosphokinase n=1 Tax=unclassified Parvimonas TaxID=1151464 RepID=UPI002B4AAD15|nr:MULTISPECIES: GTP pyrophosphokinase [unclassified Parvimonas]MEB3025616.1 GTP pyrophosphokinase [Parvimonas sp. M13]MEB3089752.1 GTP pyrophosphokinase [Parvimonas sp. M20]